MYHFFSLMLSRGSFSWQGPLFSLLPALRVLPLPEFPKSSELALLLACVSALHIGYCVFPDLQLYLL